MKKNGAKTQNRFVRRERELIGLRSPHTAAPAPRVRMCLVSRMCHTLALMPRLPRADLAVLGAIVLAPATRTRLELGRPSRATRWHHTLRKRGAVAPAQLSALLSAARRPPVAPAAASRARRGKGWGVVPGAAPSSCTTVRTVPACVGGGASGAPALLVRSGDQVIR